jgi:NadR type nicotinamide-nucleotide adenylyltransferase
VSSRPASVVLIGPESTGKTRLAARLAAHYGVPWSPEHAREYVEANARPLGYEDVELIGRGQQAGEDATRKQSETQGAGFVLHDTDLVSTLVYSRHYYADCPAWIESAARERRGDLYLLHHPDVDWVADGLQREQPARREELFRAFRETLESLEAAIADIHGSWAEREQRARAAIDALRG